MSDQSSPKHLKTRDWLFIQQRSIEKPIYLQFPQSFIPKHEASLGLPHRINCHSFCHAYATHSFAAGMDIETLSLLNGAFLYTEHTDLCPSCPAWASNPTVSKPDGRDGGTVMISAAELGIPEDIFSFVKDEPSLGTSKRQQIFLIAGDKVLSDPSISLIS